VFKGYEPVEAVTVCLGYREVINDFADRGILFTGRCYFGEELIDGGTVREKDGEGVEAGRIRVDVLLVEVVHQDRAVRDVLVEHRFNLVQHVSLERMIRSRPSLPFSYAQITGGVRDRVPAVGDGVEELVALSQTVSRAFSRLARLVAVKKSE